MHVHRSTAAKADRGHRWPWPCVPFAIAFVGTLPAAAPPSSTVQAASGIGTGPYVPAWVAIKTGSASSVTLNGAGGPLGAAQTLAPAADCGVNQGTAASRFLTFRGATHELQRGPRVVPERLDRGEGEEERHVVLPGERRDDRDPEAGARRGGRDRPRHQRRRQLGVPRPRAQAERPHPRDGSRSAAVTRAPTSCRAAPPSVCRRCPAPPPRPSPATTRPTPARTPGSTTTAAGRSACRRGPAPTTASSSTPSRSRPSRAPSRSRAVATAPCSRSRRRPLPNASVLEIVEGTDRPAAARRARRPRPATTPQVTVYRLGNVGSTPCTPVRTPQQRGQVSPSSSSRSTARPAPSSSGTSRGGARHGAGTTALPDLKIDYEMPAPGHDVDARLVPGLRRYGPPGPFYSGYSGGSCRLCDRPGPDLDGMQYACVISRDAKSRRRRPRTSTATSARTWSTSSATRGCSWLAHGRAGARASGPAHPAAPGVPATRATPRRPASSSPAVPLDAAAHPQQECLLVGQLLARAARMPLVTISSASSTRSERQQRSPRWRQVRGMEKAASAPAARSAPSMMRQRVLGAPSSAAPPRPAPAPRPGRWWGCPAPRSVETTSAARCSASSSSPRVRYTRASCIWPSARNRTRRTRAAPGWRRRGSSSASSTSALVDEQLGEVDVGLGGHEGASGLQRHLPAGPVPLGRLGPPTGVVGQRPQVRADPRLELAQPVLDADVEGLEVSRPEAGYAQLEVDRVQEHERPHQGLVVAELPLRPPWPARPSAWPPRGRSCSTRTSAVRLSSRTRVLPRRGVVPRHRAALAPARPRAAPW